MKPDLSSGNLNRDRSAAAAGITEKSMVISLIAAAASIITIVLLMYIVISGNILVPDKTVSQLGKTIFVFPNENSGYHKYGCPLPIRGNKVSDNSAALRTVCRISKSGSENLSRPDIEFDMVDDFDFYSDTDCGSGLNKSKGNAHAVRLMRKLLGITDDLDMWSGPYNWIPNDIFNEWTEIVQKVENKLHFRVPLTQFTTGPPPAALIRVCKYSSIKSASFRRIISSGIDISSPTKLYGKAIELDSDLAAAFAGLAVAHPGIFFHHNGDHSNIIKARQIFAKTAEQDPEPAKPLPENMRYYCLHTGNFKQSIRDYGSKLKVNRKMICRILNT